MAVCDADAHFNVGNLATLLIYDKLNVERGFYTTQGCIDDNYCRVNNMSRKSYNNFEGRRKILRGEKNTKACKVRKLKEVFMELENFTRFIGPLYLLTFPRYVSFIGPLYLLTFPGMFLL